MKETNRSLLYEVIGVNCFIFEKRWKELAVSREDIPEGRTNMCKGPNVGKILEEWKTYHVARDQQVRRLEVGKPGHAGPCSYVGSLGFMFQKGKSSKSLSKERSP